MGLLADWELRVILYLKALRKPQGTTQMFLLEFKEQEPEIMYAQGSICIFKLKFIFAISLINFGCFVGLRVWKPSLTKVASKILSCMHYNGVSTAFYITDYNGKNTRPGSKNTQDWPPGLQCPPRWHSLTILLLTPCFYPQHERTSFASALCKRNLWFERHGPNKLEQVLLLV